MKILYIEPGKEPRVMDVEHRLDVFKKLVGGYIEAVYPWRDPAALVCNEEGKLNMKKNRVLADENGRPYDVIHGPFFICGLKRDDFADLPDDLAEKYTEMFQDATEPEMDVEPSVMFFF